MGASDTGISFIEALLSISYLQFTNIVLIAPGGLPHHHYGDDKGANLKAQSTSYTQQELKRLMKGVCMSVCDPQEGEGDHLPPHGCSRQPA